MLKNRNKHRVLEKNIIYILILLICTVLVIAIGVVRSNKTQKEQSKTNKQIEEKNKQEEEHIKALKVYDGLILSTFGDSITAQAQWQPLVVSELGFTKYNNLGIAGSKVSGNSDNAMWQDARINQIPADSNVIIFMGGINDWAQNVPLGTLNSTDISTFYGALNIVYNKLDAKFPNAKIVFMSTTFAMAPNRGIFQNKIGLVNNFGLINTDYGNAIGKVANTKKIPFIDLSNCGWNKDNISKYVGYDGSYIHPNAEGGKKMAKVIVNRLREIGAIK